MGDPEEKPPGRGQGQGAVAGHEKGQDAAIDGLVEALGALTDRVAALENAADGTE